MNKEIFLRDLRRFLADIPEDEREQALNYYEDYFEDAGPENEQKVIEELGAPVDIAKQIKATNQENIAYGQGNDFHQSTDYPNVYETGNNNNTQKNTQSFTDSSNNSKQTNQSQNNQNTDSNSQNNYYNNSYSQGYGTQNGSTYQYQEPKKSWTQDSTKVAIVIVLAILAIPVGIPVISAIFSVFVAICAVIFSLIIVCFAVGASLAVSGIISLIGSLFAISSGGIAGSLITAGIGLVFVSIGIFIFWFGTIFCSKFFPAIFRCFGKCFRSIRDRIRIFFS